MGCTRCKLMEIPRCEPITSFGWLGSWSSRLDDKRTYRGTLHLRTYVRIQYNEKRLKKAICTILPPNGGQNIVHSSCR